MTLLNYANVIFRLVRTVLRIQRKRDSPPKREPPITVLRIGPKLALASCTAQATLSVGGAVRSKGSLGLRRARRSSSEAGLHHQFPRRDRQGSSHLPFWRFGVPLCDVPSWWVSLVPCSGVPRTSTIKRFFFSAFAFVWRTCWTNVE